MDTETKIAFALLMGQLYRVLKRQEPPIAVPGDDVIFGLLYGIESVIDEYIDELNFITREKERKISEILGRYQHDDEKFAELDGYDMLEPEFKQNDITRVEVVTVLRYYNTKGLFDRVLKRLKEGRSPIEMQTLDLEEGDI